MVTDETEVRTSLFRTRVTQDSNQTEPDSITLQDVNEVVEDRDGGDEVAKLGILVEIQRDRQWRNNPPMRTGLQVILCQCKLNLVAVARAGCRGGVRRLRE